MHEIIFKGLPHTVISLFHLLLFEEQNGEHEKRLLHKCRALFEKKIIYLLLQCLKPSVLIENLIAET
jgi:hypothetical protein